MPGRETQGERESEGERQRWIVGKLSETLIQV